MLWLEDAESIDDRWVTAGAVAIFTGRGRRLLEVVLDDTAAAGFIVPLPRSPGVAELEWSEWLPQIESSDQPPPDGFHYRFRVHPVDMPIRTASHGPFEIEVTAREFHEGTARDRSVTRLDGGIAIRHLGVPIGELPVSGHRSEEVRRFTEVLSTAGVAAVDPTLLVRIRNYGLNHSCYLLTSQDDRVSARFVTECGRETELFEVRGDAAGGTAQRGAELRDGRFHPGLLERDRLYLFGDAIIDTRTLDVHPLAPAPWISEIPDRAPLGLAPDWRSFVRLAYRQAGGGSPVLAVTDLNGENPYTLRLDRSMYESADGFDHAWLLRHFEWVDDSGTWRLVARVPAATGP